MNGIQYVFIISLQGKEWTDQLIDREGEAGSERVGTDTRYSGVQLLQASAPFYPLIVLTSPKAGNTERPSARHSQSTAGRSHAGHANERASLFWTAFVRRRPVGAPAAGIVQ